MDIKKEVVTVTRIISSVIECTIIDDEASAMLTEANYKLSKVLEHIEDDNEEY